MNIFNLSFIQIIYSRFIIIIICHFYITEELFNFRTFIVYSEGNNNMKKIEATLRRLRLRTM